MNQQRGFLGALFDISFSELITTRVIKVLFVLAIIGAAVLVVTQIIGAFLYSVGVGVLVLLISPLVFTLYVTVARIYLEVLIVIFRISDDVKRIADKEARGA
jgi:fatty acid desaturase